MPSSGVSVPFHVFQNKQGSFYGKPYLVERERTLVSQDTTSTMKHAIVSPFGGRLHTLHVTDNQNQELKPSW